MTDRLIIMGPSQSNGLGVDASAAPVGLPLATVDFFRNLGSGGANYNHVDTGPVSLRVTDTAVDSCGPEGQMGLDLVAGSWAGDRIVVVKCSENGRAITDFLPTASARYYQKIQIACLAVRHLLSTSFLAYQVTNQGEFEALAATEDGALAWGTNEGTIISALETFLGRSFTKRAIVRCRNDIGNWPVTQRAQQAARATGKVALINRDDTPADELGTYGTINVHDVTTAVNTIGSRIAAHFMG